MGITLSTLRSKEMLSFYVLVSSIILAEIPSSVESVPAPVPEVQLVTSPIESVPAFVPEGNRNRTSVILPIQAFQPCFDACKAVDFNGEFSCYPIPAPIKCDKLFPYHSFPPNPRLRSRSPPIVVIIETPCCIHVIVFYGQNVLVENSDKN